MVCEDCGKFGVMHENGITIFVVNKEFFAMSHCMFCDRVVKDSIEIKTVDVLFEFGVKVFDFNTGEQILDKIILDEI